MKKKNKSQLSAVEQFKTACNELAELVNQQLFYGSRQWYWICGDVGGVCDFEDDDVLNLEDMVRIIEHNMTYDKYAEWRDANIAHNRYINLKAWLMGARHNILNKNNN